MDEINCGCISQDIDKRVRLSNYLDRFIDIQLGIRLAFLIKLEYIFCTILCGFVIAHVTKKRNENDTFLVIEKYRAYTENSHFCKSVNPFDCKK